MFLLQYFRSPIIELEKKCNHPTVIKDLCAECGADLQKEDVKEGAPVSQASVSMVHMVPELKVNEEVTFDSYCVYYEIPFKKYQNIVLVNLLS